MPVPSPSAVSWRVMGTVATSLIVSSSLADWPCPSPSGSSSSSRKSGSSGFMSASGIVSAWPRGGAAGGRLADRASGFRKSTLSQWVADALRRKGFKVEQLDGEMVRQLFPRTGFTRPERDEHVRRLGFLASKLEQQGVCVVAATVSPYADSRDFVRHICRNFVEVHVATPLADCERRDPKGLYPQARLGTIRNFTGVDDPYEAPVQPDVRVNPGAETIEQTGAQVLSAVEERMHRRSRPPSDSGDVAQPRKSFLDNLLAFGRSGG